MTENPPWNWFQISISIKKHLWHLKKAKWGCHSLPEHNTSLLKFTTYEGTWKMVWNTPAEIRNFQLEIMQKPKARTKIGEGKFKNGKQRQKVRHTNAKKKTFCILNINFMLNSFVALLCIVWVLLWNQPTSPGEYFHGFPSHSKVHSRPLQSWLKSTSMTDKATLRGEPWCQGVVPEQMEVESLSWDLEPNKNLICSY